VNILQLCKYYPPVLGGIELVEKTITKAHVDLGDRVFIVAFSRNKDNRIGELGESIHLVRQDIFLKSAPISLGFIFYFKKMIKANRINRLYVHLPNPYMHEVLRIFKDFLKKEKVEVIAVYHSDIVNQKILGKIYNCYFSLTKHIYNYWICSSQKLWESSLILKNIAVEKKRIIPFCSDAQMTFRGRDKFKGKLLAVGRLVPYKGFEFLVRAINKTKYELHIIGNGPEYEKLKKISASNIILHKNINDREKRELFNQCDVLVISSINRAEAYGITIVEAFEAGLPVIASNLDSGVTFLVQHEKTGLVFDTKDEEKLLHAIERLEKENDLYSQISRNTKKFFDSELSYDHFKNKIKNISHSGN
jgi:rhamnosyl/mannosyltransferase